MKPHTIPKTLGLISMLFAVSLAMAADPGMNMHRQGHDMGCGSMGMMSGDTKMDPVARAQKHLGELKAKLNLTTDQQSAWRTFSDQVNDQAKNMASMRDKMMDNAKPTAKTAPEHMARMADMMKDGAQNMAKMAAAVKTFYDTLTPEQQAAFDKMHTRHMKHMK